MTSRWNQSDGGGTRIKICGITTTEVAQVAVEAGADAIGLVMVPSSPRGISWAMAETIRASLPSHVEAIGLVQDQQNLRGLASVYGGSWLQFHGQECEETVASWDGPTIRGFQFSPEAVRRWDACDGVDLLLVDGSKGGEGIAIDTAAVADIAGSLRHRLVLAGGLTPDTVHEAVLAVRPWGVDVSSGVESSRGIKDHGLIRAFCQAVVT